MPLSPISLPRDFSPLTELAIDAFQYPENPAWNLQQDEAEDTARMMKNLQRLWPLIRPLMLVSPPLRDILRGYFWLDETGKAVGSSVIQRLGESDAWVIGNVAVLPGYRRQGIGRRLVIACLDLIRERGGKLAWLEVVKGNLPAYELYLRLGFEPYSSEVVLERRPPYPEVEVDFPADVKLESWSRYNWRPRYSLDQRIVPDAVKKYQPVEERSYRSPLAMRVLGPILMLAQGSRPAHFLIRETSGGRPLAIFGSNIPGRHGGLARLQARLDPDRPDLAQPLVASLLGRLARVGGTQRTEWILKSWMPALIEAAEQAGFAREYEAISMGREV